MANVTEAVTYDAGIYQIETTDPVVGGASGIANVQAKQLANRTAFLKQFADEVSAARGGKASLDARLDTYDLLDPEMQTNIGQMVIAAISEAGIANRELQILLTKRTQKRTAILRNTGVVSGCDATAGGTGRLVNLSAGLTYINGQRVPISAQISTASIAQNTGSATDYVELYLDSTGDLKATNLGGTSPANTMVLYRVTVPANNTAEDLAGCTLTKTASIQAAYPVYYTAYPKVSIVLPFAMPNNDYTVDLEVTGYSGGAAQLGDVFAINKTTTGFDIVTNGTADNIAVRWTMTKYNL